MPNWVTNKVEAPQEVLSGLINPEGKIDFAMAVSLGGSWPWDYVIGDAETAAKVVTRKPLNANPMIASLESHNRGQVDILKLEDESFEQFVQMLRNKRACGHFHSMDNAIQAWGTKWNACQQKVDLDAGVLEFDTAWSCPVPVFKALSAKFPSAEIKVIYADEDLGSNCGTLIFKAGEIESSDVAGSWREMDEQERDKWTAFARQVTGRPDDEDDD